MLSIYIYSVLFPISYKHMNRTGLYAEKAVESAGLLGVHQLIRLDPFVSIQYSHEGQGPGLGIETVGMFLPAVYLMPRQGR